MIAQQAEEDKLRRIVIDADAERQRQQKELEAVITERDILGTQVCMCIHDAESKLNCDCAFAAFIQDMTA